MLYQSSVSSGAINTTSYSSSSTSTINNNGFKFHHGITRNSSKDLFNHIGNNKNGNGSNINSIKNINASSNVNVNSNNNNVRKNSGDAIITQQQDIMEE